MLVMGLSDFGTEQELLAIGLMMQFRSILSDVFNRPAGNGIPSSSQPSTVPPTPVLCDSSPLPRLLRERAFSC